MLVYIDNRWSKKFAKESVLHRYLPPPPVDWRNGECRCETRGESWESSL